MRGYSGPRLRPNRQLLRAVRASGLPGWQLALVAGIPHHSTFSALINSKTVPDSRLTRERLERIADAVGFDRALLFPGGAR